MTTTPRIIALPVANADGMDSPLSGHYARSPLHAVVNTGDYAIHSIPTNPGDSGMERIPLAEMKAAGVGMVICRQIGRHAYQYLKANEIEVMITTASNIREAVMEMDSSKLVPPSDEILDHEGVMKHRHGHTHGGEHGEQCAHHAGGKRCCETDEGGHGRAGGHGCCHRHGHGHGCTPNHE